MVDGKVALWRERVTERMFIPLHSTWIATRGMRTKGITESSSLFEKMLALQNRASPLRLRNTTFRSRRQCSLRAISSHSTCGEK
jgi:hypothetical protein